MVCLLNARILDAFAFGDEAAASPGVNVGRTRIVLFALTAITQRHTFTSCVRYHIIGIFCFAGANECVRRDLQTEINS